MVLAVIGAVIWFWWPQKHPKKVEKREPVIRASAVVAPPVPPVEKSRPKPIVITPQPPAGRGDRFADARGHRGVSALAKIS